jgi:hypothetical protein
MAMAKRQGKAAKPAERRGVAFKLPGDLITDLEAIATKENRSQAKQVEVALRQFVQSYRGRAAACQSTSPTPATWSAKPTNS